MLEVDQSIENSTMSIQSTASTATTRSKRKAPPRTKSTKSKRAKTTRTKKQEVELELEPETEPRQELEGQELPAEAEPAEESPYPVLPAVPVGRAVDDDGNEQQVEEESVPQPMIAETGPPEKDESPVPVKQNSPLKEQINPPRPTISPSQVEEKGEQEQHVITPSRSKDRSPSQPSDIENAPPSSRPESVRPPLSSPGAPAPIWTPVDIDTVFKNDEEMDLFADAQNGQLSEQERGMTVQEWIEHVATQAEQNLNQEAERIVSIFEREGQRALKVLEGIICV